MELWKYGEKEIYIRLIQLYNEIWAQGNIPLDWNTLIVIPIHKKREKNICSNYRGISLLTSASKIYAAILKEKN